MEFLESLLTADDIILGVQVLIGIAFVLALVQLALQKAEQSDAWKACAEQLGLRYEDGTLVGEYAELPVRVKMEFRSTGSDRTAFCIVSTKVPGELPFGFVAAPRAWTTFMDRALADPLIPTDNPALNEAFVFQSDLRAQGEKLLEAGEVRDALLALYGPGRVGFVERGRVAIAHQTHLSDPEALRACLDTVTHTARVLASGEPSWRDVLPTPRIAS
jgi:hypothetical protein